MSKQGTQYLPLIESIRGREAEIHRVFGNDLGRRVADNTPTVASHGRSEYRHYTRQLAEAHRFIERIEKGRLPMHYLKEAMTTSDFPFLFADIIDRKLLGYYDAAKPMWETIANRNAVPDLRNVKRFAMDGAEAVLPEVGENEEYPGAALTDKKDEYAVRKYGRRLDLSWEAMINDDLDAFRRNPERLARAAIRSESKFVTELYCGKKGPNENLYTAGHKNIINVEGGTKNPELSVKGLQEGLLQLAEMRDFDGEPIVVDAVTLVVPPALQVTAKNMLNALQIWLNQEAGTEKQQVHAENWMRNEVTLQVDPYIPLVAVTEHANTSWFLFASPTVGRPALELGFLRGYEQPSLYERMPTARRIGGGGGEVNESFEDDSVAWRIRHILGGTQLLETGGYKTTVASNGAKA